MILGNILEKYRNQFNFFRFKPINEVISNETSAETTIRYKDSAILSQKNEYLKRFYWIKNAVGRNEIYDRIHMLSDFYGNAVVLRYEHPLMIVTDTKQIFMKRLRRMKKMIASDCSSDESLLQKSESESEDPLSFDSSRFLRSIETGELSSNANEISKNLSSNSFSISYDESVHDVYATNTTTRLPNKKAAMHEQGILFDYSSINHLVIDIDDVDTEKALADYNKIQGRASLLTAPNEKSQTMSKKSYLKKSKVVITPIDYYVPEQVYESSLPKNEKYYPSLSPASKYRKHQTYRYRQGYDETIRLADGLQKNQRHYLSRGLHETDIELETERQYFSIHSRDKMNKGSDRKYSEKIKVERNHRVSLAPEPYTEQGNSRKSHNKVQVREKAMALLRKARSDDRMPTYNNYRWA